MGVLLLCRGTGRLCVYLINKCKYLDLWSSSGMGWAGVLPLGGVLPWAGVLPWGGASCFVPMQHNFDFNIAIGAVPFRCI